MLKLPIRKRYKFGLVFLAIPLVGSLGFCFASFALAQNGNQNLCEETGHKNQVRGTFGLIISNNNNQPSTNSLLPCCQNHETGNKIDTVKRQTINNQPAQANGENHTPKTLESPNHFSCAIQSDSPPPEAKLVGSVYKKE